MPTPTNVGTVTETYDSKTDCRVSVVKLDCTADTGDVVYTLTSSSKLQGCMLMQVDVVPIVAPTASSDLYVYASNGCKVANTDFENKVTTTATQSWPSEGNPILWDTWYIDIDNNIVASARVLIWLYFYKL